MRLREHDVVATVRRLQLRELRSWVRAGWIKPARGDGGPFFDELDIARIRLICDLRKEMSLSADTVPTILSLLDQLHGLRHQLHRLAEAVNQQPEETRIAVLKAYRRLEGRD
ncbi:chaperone modulator CbpM [Leisingera methylohalidivorans]|uniref:MerR family transcriptional regulator n=1 Tax=Leisingera methylohalidivorans DSM 14336 TaxID=999552 RepID=V9VU77_9RHOB|nr:chaperone modulator CbpM [Leisingera methylohalidivorans]AHD00865.1 hypothetical protein METH_09370 [Leisingera methylohalidivorans DSM 14336]